MLNNNQELIFFIDKTDNNKRPDKSTGLIGVSLGHQLSRINRWFVGLFCLLFLTKDTPMTHQIVPASRPYAVSVVNGVTLNHYQNMTAEEAYQVHLTIEDAKNQSKQFLKEFFGMSDKKDVSIFKFNDKEVRAIEIDGKPYFVARDVCDVLEIKDITSTIKRLDEDEKLTKKLSVSGQSRDIWIINESGLYKLIFTSNKPEAKSFTKWVTDEVLPAIRKHGEYRSKENNVSISDIEEGLQILENHKKDVQKQISNLNSELTRIKGVKVTLMERAINIIEKVSQDYEFEDIDLKKMPLAAIHTHIILKNHFLDKRDLMIEDKIKKLK
jgi:prophage antirepressor-like protein